MAKAELRPTGLWYLLLALPVATVILFCFEPMGQAEDGSRVWRVLPGMEQAEGIIGLAAGVILFFAFQCRFWPRADRESRSLRSAAVLVLIEAVILRLAHDLGMHLYGEAEFPRAEGWLRMPWFFVPALGVVLLGWR
jgi:hypothetical protein